MAAASHPRHCEEDIESTVREQKVFVEKYDFSKHENAVLGTVRVQNIAYKKSVSTRYTLDNWKTHADLKAAWEKSIGDGEPPETDQFSFKIPLPSPKWSGFVQFAIRYRVAGHKYWDNNYKKNYEIEICRK